MKVSVFSILALFSLSWKNSDYAKFDHNSFAKSKGAKTEIDIKKIDYELLNAAVFYETNRQRKLHKLTEFQHSPALEKAAHEHSQDMARLNFFSHTSKIPQKKSMKMRLAAVGISNAATAENIAISFAIAYEGGKPFYNLPGGGRSYTHNGPAIPMHTYLSCAKAVVANWMKSPGHRRNILNPGYKFLGAGSALFMRNKMETFKFTQNFASVQGPAKQD